MPAKFQALLQLIRFDKPIGTLLLLWPTLWALWIANEGAPPLSLLVIFALGTFLMRSAGCIVNDFADRNFDGAVARTQTRPLVTGSVSVKEAGLFCLCLCLIAFGLVLMTNPLTISLSLVAVVLAASYPFMKRFTHLPQFVLGMAFSWGIPMAFAASQNTLPTGLWLIYVGNLLWTVAYDTAYAMVDRDDEVKIGIKSTAILFGRYDRGIIAALQLATVSLWWTVGMYFSLGPYYYISLCAAAGLFVYHQWLIRQRDPAQCFQAFLNNSWVGAVMLLGIVCHFALGV
jgi:4-hydroxybenzoate polyprenyltransferase